MVLVFRRFFQVDKNGVVIMCKLLTLSKYIFTFVISGETEAGTAGEQPARDSLTADENVRLKGCFLAAL